MPETKKEPNTEHKGSAPMDPKKKKQVIIVGGLGVLVLVYLYMRNKNASSSATPATTTTMPASSTDPYAMGGYGSYGNVGSGGVPGNTTTDNSNQGNTINNSNQGNPITSPSTTNVYNAAPILKTIAKRKTAMPAFKGGKAPGTKSLTSNAAKPVIHTSGGVISKGTATATAKPVKSTRSAGTKTYGM